jgi:hypothetical protein
MVAVAQQVSIPIPCNLQEGRRDADNESERVHSGLHLRPHVTSDSKIGIRGREHPGLLVFIESCSERTRLREWQSDRGNTQDVGWTNCGYAGGSVIGQNVPLDRADPGQVRDGYVPPLRKVSRARWIVSECFSMFGEDRRHRAYSAGLVESCRPACDGCSGATYSLSMLFCHALARAGEPLGTLFRCHPPNESPCGPLELKIPLNLGRRSYGRAHMSFP